MKNTKSTCYFFVPYNISEVWGIRKAVKVKATIDKYFHRGLIVPDGKGNHYMGLKAVIMHELGKSAGDVVNVTLEIDTEERIVEIPTELKKVLRKTQKKKNISNRFLTRTGKNTLNGLLQQKKRKRKK